MIAESDLGLRGVPHPESPIDEATKGAVEAVLNWSNPFYSFEEYYWVQPP